MWRHGDMVRLLVRVYRRLCVLRKGCSERYCSIENGVCRVQPSLCGRRLGNSVRVLMIAISRIFVRSSVVVALCLASSGKAEPLAEIQTRRLAETCKVWGAIRYLHPYLAS